MFNQINLLKNELRQDMKAKLANISSEDFINFNAAIFKHFFELPVVNNSNRIMIYYAINREVDTVQIISILMDKGKTVALPACTLDKNLKAGIIHNFDELVPGKFGLKEPANSALEIVPADLDLIVVPGLAFDKRGSRLGHGAGYYDRFLARTNAYIMGLAYDFQIVEKLPVEPHDIVVQALLTPAGYREISGANIIF